MTKYRFAIPSYKRAESPLTVDLLASLGYTKDEIIVGTQTSEDYEKYVRAQGEKATITYKPGENDSQNRNNVLECFEKNEPLLLVDDDIREFSRLSDDGKSLRKINSRDELEYYFTKMFSYAKRNAALLWAWYPVDNAFFMKRSIDRRNILVGTIFGIINAEMRPFNPRYSLKGDFEISLRMMAQGYNAVRFNGFTCRARHKSAGGCEEERAAGRNEQFYRELLITYPGLVKKNRRAGEIAFTGNRMTEWESALWR